MTLARRASIVAVATALSRVLGFLRDALLAAALGAGPLADAFVAAFQLPNLARRLLAEGALNAAFVPLWLRRREEAGAVGAARLTGAALGTLMAVLLPLVALAGWAMPALIGTVAPGFSPDVADIAVAYGRLAVPYVALAGTVAICAALLNAQGRVAAAALAPVVFNATLILALLAALLAGLAESARAGAWLAGAVVVAGVAQVLLVGLAARRLPERAFGPVRVRADADMRRLFGRAGPGLLAAAAPQLKILAGVAIASGASGAVSHLWYANRLFELPLGLVSAIVAAVMVPALGLTLRQGAKAMAATQSRAVELALALTLPAAAGLAVLAEPIVRVLFERGAFTPADTAATAAVLVALALGLPGHVLEKIVAAGCFAHEDATTPMLAALAGLAVAALGGWLAFPAAGAVGVAAAIAVSGWLAAGMLIAIEARRGRLALAPAVLRTAAKLLAATAAMAAALSLAAPFWSGSLALFAVIGGAVALYGGLVHLTGALDLKALAGLVR